MDASEEADFLMACNEFELDPEIEKLLVKCDRKNIPMYVLSNSGFRAEALTEILYRFEIGKHFRNLWSSADFGKIKPCKDFFEIAIQTALLENPNEDRENIIFIGDTYKTDIIGANKAGIKAAWLNKKGECDVNRLATYNCASTDQLLEII